MNHKLRLLLGLIYAAWATQSAAWEARFNGSLDSTDGVFDIALDNFGNCYVTGWVLGISTEFDIGTIKYDRSGNELWAQINALGPETDGGMALAADSVGNVFVAGFTWTISSQADYVIIKYNSAGEQIWITQLDSPLHEYDIASDIALDAQGNIYITGYYGGDYLTFDHGDFGTAKLDSAGNLLWLTTYDGPGMGYDGAYCLSLDPWGNVIVTGRSIDQDSDYATVKYSPAGEELWVARYDGMVYYIDQPEDLCVDQCGNAYVTGSIGGSFGTGDSTNIATIKYDSSGCEQWVAIYDGPAGRGDIGESIAVDPLGNVYMAGMCTVIDFYQTDYITIKYDSSGQEIWASCYSGISTDFCQNYAQALALDQNGNIYVTGRSYGLDPWFTGRDYDIATVKYSPDGQQIGVIRYDGPANDEDQGTAIAIDQTGYVYVAGYSAGIGTGWDYITIRYDQDSLGIVQLENPIPGEFRLYPAFPNPFNPTTTISFQVPADSHVSLQVYNLAGRLVATLVNGYRDAGVYQVSFDASNLPSGIYLYNLTAGNFNATGKMVMLK